MLSSLTSSESLCKPCTELSKEFSRGAHAETLRPPFWQGGLRWIYSVSLSAPEPLPSVHLYKRCDALEGSNFLSPNLTYLCVGYPENLRNTMTGTFLEGLSTHLLLQLAPGHHWALTRCQGRPADGSCSCSFQCLFLPHC